MNYLELFRQHYDIHSEVQIRPRYNLDNEIESIDVIIDDLPDSLHCSEFAMNDVSEPVGHCKRFEAQRAVALHELTPGIYNEHGNPIKEKQ